MTIAIMAIIGLIVGFVNDELIARLAREPFERGDLDDEDAPQSQPNDGASLDLSSETGAVAMPSLLTTAAWYRRGTVVAVTSLLFALVGAQYGGDESHLAVVAFYVSVLIICASTDILAYRVPNAVTYPAIVAAFVIGMVIPGTNRLDVLFGGLLFGGLLLVPSILTRGAMGMGDVKLAFFVGFALGLTMVVPAMLVMAISGGIAAGIMLLVRARGKSDPMPYAPFISGGAIVAMLLGGTAFVEL